MNQKEWEKEHKKLIAEEKRFLKKGKEEKTSFLAEKAERFISDGVREKLEAAFRKGFEVVFTKGSSVIEKTYSKAKYEEDYKIHHYAMETKEKKPLSGFKKKAAAAGRKNLVLSGAEGVGFGILGIGLPDIPVFIGMMMKTVQEIALSYGYSYESEEEKIFILKVIRAALSGGDKRADENRSLGKWICGFENEAMPLEDEITKTAKVLSDRLLYMKFIQGIPIVGVLGGISDFAVTKEISDYARFIYKKRFLRDRWKEQKDHEKN